MSKVVRGGESTGQQLALVTGPSLEACEDVIAAGIQTFYEVGTALAHIRDAGLYRAGYVTFQAYLQERWGFGMNHANQLIATADIVHSMGQLEVAPSTPAVAERLRPLPSRMRAEVWREALAATKRQSHGRPNPTAQEVEDLVAAKLAAVGERPPSSTRTAFLSEEEEAIMRRVRGGETVVANFRQQAELIGQADSEGLFVRIDRNTRWGNPFVFDEDGDRAAVITAYRDHYLPHKPSLLERMEELEGRLLGCWCAPEPCHGDVLAERANARSKAS